MKSLWIPLSLIVASAIGATITRSPRDVANAVKKIDSSTNVVVTTKTAPSLSALIPPTLSARTVIVRPPRSYHITLMCDPVATAKGFHVYKGTNGQIYELIASITNNWFTVSNLWPKTDYVFVFATIDTNGLVSNYSPAVYWPQPKTNYLAFGDSVYAVGPWRTNAIVAVVATNTKAFYRGQRRGGLYEVISSPDLRMWTPPITNWAATNVVLASILRCSEWSNWDYAHAD